RLPRAGGARLAGAQAEGDATGQGGAAAGGTGGGVEREAGQPVAAGVVGVGVHPAVYAAARLDGEPARDDGQGGPVSRNPSGRAGSSTCAGGVGHVGLPGSAEGG